MTDLTQAGRNYERSLEMMNDGIDEREKAIQERTDQIAEQMVRDRTPTVERALRKLLEAGKFDDTILDLMHAMLWSTSDLYVRHRISQFKTRLLDRAPRECNVRDAARAQAKKEIDGGAL